MPVDLHYAKCMDELNKQATTPAFQSMYKSKPAGLYKLAKQMYHQINQSREDNELAYIYSFRFLKLLEVIYRRDTDKHFVQLQFDSMRKEVGELYTELQKSLQRRYDQLAQKKLSEVPEEPTTTIKVDDKSVSNIFGDDIFISSQQLYQELPNVAENMLIIDIRSSTHFNESKLNGNYHLINIDNNLIERGLSAFKLEEKLDKVTKDKFAKRDEYIYILLLDNDTVKESFQTSKLKILNDILTLWDVNKNYNHAPYVLNGGYVDFVDMYPTHSTNPHVVCTDRYGDLDDILNLDAINYPPMERFGHTSIVSVTPKDILENMFLELLKLCQIIETTEKELLQFEENLLIMMQSSEYSSSEKERLEYSRASCDLQRRAHYERKDEMKKVMIKEVKTHKLNESDYFNRPELLHLERSIVDVSRKRRKVAEELKKYELEEGEKEKEEEKKPQPIVGDSSHNKPVPSEEIVKRPPPPELVKLIPPKVNRATKPLKPISSDRGLNGLVNIKNSCYMNSIIQCLRHIPYLRYYCISGEYRNEITTKHPKLILEFSDLIKQMWMGHSSAVRPTTFYNAITRLYPDFRRGNHEDANEFFMIVFSYLSDDVARDIPEMARYLPADRTSFYRLTQQKESFFINNFYHQIRMDTECQKCLKREMRFETENVLILDMPLRGNTSLEKLVHVFMTTCDVNTLFCNDCEKPSAFDRKVTYLPRILTILLKRYTANRDGVYVKKTTSCSYPLDGLIFGKARYKLWGLCLHQGSLSSGHYTAACQNILDNRWYELNDEMVRPIDLTPTTYEKEVYLLFYQLVDEKMVGFL
nr:ubiquitin carboxyl-terminal hydrolase 8-like [Onthophagus taurus]